MKMTDEQRKLVEDNHKLIYGFLNKKELDVDEYYDIAAIGLCKAVMKYDITKSKFSTFAYKYMNREIGIYLTYLNKKSNIPKYSIFSYDTPVDERIDAGNTYGNSVLTDGFDFSDFVVEDISFLSFTNKLKDKEKLIIKYLEEGLTQQEIAKKTNKSQQAISLSIKNIKEKWKRFSNK